MTLYTQQTINNLINKYIEKGGAIYEIAGCLQDNYILTADGYKTAIIKEKYINDWSSGQSITLYNKIPKKYQQVIDLLENDETEKANKLFFA